MGRAHAINLMPFPALIHVTALYSNAVLVAILPYVSDFAKKLEMPLPQPITTNQVRLFKPDNLEGKIGGFLILTNGCQFWFNSGMVDSFSADNDVYRLQEYSHIADWYGPTNLAKPEAIRMSRRAIEKLGYSLKQAHADREPTNYEPPDMIGTNIIPFCKVEWNYPDEFSFVHTHIDAEHRELVNLFIANTNFWHADPKVTVIPELDSEYQKRMKGQTNAPKEKP